MKPKKPTAEERAARKAESERIQKMLRDRMRRIEAEFAARGQKLE
jgi:hypothetical protein